jgi:hypothetical protein
VRLLRPAGFLAFPILATIVVAAATAAPLPNACTLVGDAQLSNALGVKVHHNAPRATNGARMCVWQKTSFDGGPNPSLTLTVLPLAREAFTKKWSRSMTGVRPVAGVGEMAYAVNGGIWLVAWSRGIEVVVNSSEVRSPLETAKRVAKLALARL